ncbi:MAG TPA: hypothetical protein PLI00_12045 [Pseudomonadota bacterium]|nr:hypothetical protein [Pseudomonadota bacterium]HQY37306.1 hypothetical protein [Pseudomonadota bacterium]
MLWSILATGFAVAFVHAALPTHWLPFVLAGRAQHWSTARTLAVTAIAGGGHVAFTVLLGVLVAALGIAVERWTEGVFPWIAGGVLLAMGAYYIARQMNDAGHGHSHDDVAGHDHDHGHGHAQVPAAGNGHEQRLATLAQVASEADGARRQRPRSDRSVIVGLVAMLTFSPCEGFLPVFLTGARFGWVGFAILSLALALATVGAMLALTALTLAGMERFGFERLARYESGILGSLLILLGLIVVVLNP